MFVVKKNEKYQILEKPTSDTPEELRREGRAKAGTKFFEFAGCPYDENTKKYDTGLDETSRDFFGKSEAEVKKLLEERKELIDYHNKMVKLHGGDERKAVAANLLKIEHNQIIDTSNISNYYRLWLAARGSAITPINEKGNLAKRNSLYTISNEKQETDYKKELAAKKFKARKWLMNKLDDDRKTALEFLRYEDILPLNQDKDNALLMDMFERHINSFEKLENFLRTIEKVTENDVFLSNDVKRQVAKGVIKKEKGVYLFDGIEIGSNIPEIVSNLKKKEFGEIAVKLLNNKKEVKK